MKAVAALRRWQPPRAARFALVALALVPLGLVVADATADNLGANPVEAVLHRTGDWTLRLLLLTLAVTPLRRWTGWSWLLSFRRPLGLLAFTYGLLHAATYLGLDRGLLWDEIVADVVKRPYVTFGVAALLLMVPLALTSTRAMMRRLGRNWQRLHRLVYAVGVLGVLHFLWLTKVDRLEPVVYAVLLAVLLLARLPASRWLGRRTAEAACE